LQAISILVQPILHHFHLELMRLSMKRAAYFALSCVVSVGCGLDGGSVRSQDASRRSDAVVGDGRTFADGATVPADAVVINPIIPEDDSGVGPLTPDAACAMETSETQRAPINILLVLDRSGSMGSPASGSSGPTKWEGATAALQSLVRTLPDDVRLGLTVFPSVSSPSTESGYTTPRVPIAALTSSRTPILNELTTLRPTGGTPMACAMSGSQRYLTQTYMADGSLNVVLITDGEPSEECVNMLNCGFFDTACWTQQTNIAKNAVLGTTATMFQRNPPIRTFAVGTLDATATFLSSVAVQGGTPRRTNCQGTNTCFYSLGANFQADLQMALDDIRGRAASCEFRLNIDLTRVDPNLVNVNFTPRTGAAPTIIPRDTNRADGWDYNDTRTSVILYGPSCDAVKAGDAGSKVEILFGCPTQVPG